VDWIKLPRDRIQWQVSCGHGIESSDSLEVREFLDQLWDHQLLEKVCAQW
jgi:hypothetical protein